MIQVIRLLVLIGMLPALIGFVLLPYAIMNGLVVDPLPVIIMRLWGGLGYIGLAIYFLYNTSGKKVEV